MGQMVLVMPCLPGGGDKLRTLAEQCRGPRRTEFEDFHRRVFLDSEHWYLQPSPQGELFILVLEGDLAQAMPKMAAADEPFDRWFKERAREVHGIDFGRPLAAPAAEDIFEG